MPANSNGRSLKLKDCSILAIATGKRAQNTRELRDQLQLIDTSSIYYHFWGGLLRPKFDDPEYANDFAAWAHHGLHDDVLAERLGVIDPTEFETLEALRAELIEVIEARLDETEHVFWARSDQQFNFIRSRLVVFDTKHQISKPQQLPEVLSTISVSSLFYHFIDARRRTPDGVDDFRHWLSDVWGEPYEPLKSKLAEVDHYFTTLSELRTELTDLLRNFFVQGSAS